MSLKHHRGSAWAFSELQKQAQAEIDRGERKGATVKYKTPNPAKTVIGWMKRRLIRGEFRRRA